jgi:chromosome segregation ATPase
MPSPERAASPSEALETLDRLIADMSAQLDEARRVVARSPTGARERLDHAILALAQKIEEARGKRERLRARMDRRRRLDVLKARATALREEVNRLGEGGDDERREALRAERGRLLAECAELLEGGDRPG